MALRKSQPKVKILTTGGAEILVLVKAPDIQRCVPLDQSPAGRWTNTL
jgi:hypothetical protein